MRWPRGHAERASISEPPVSPSVSDSRVMSPDGAVTHLLYLHGFRSSPHSTKARQFADWVREHRPDLIWWCPQLPPSPSEAVALLEHGCLDWPKQRTAVIGSSLGGFYATVLVERWGCRAVLLNPAVNPARDLTAQIGESRSWHDDAPFFFRPEFIDELRAMAPTAITRHERYLAVIAEGDEVLDWREMHARYAGCAMRVLPRDTEGSDHTLSGFEDQMPEVLAFAGLSAT
jgi:predicted esterase YcpF (UPF0227 family)